MGPVLGEEKAWAGESSGRQYEQNVSGSYVVEEVCQCNGRAQSRMAAQTRRSSGAHLASRFGALALAAGVTSKITCKADRDAPIELVREVVRREIRRKKTQKWYSTGYGITS